MHDQPTLGQVRSAVASAVLKSSKDGITRRSLGEKVFRLVGSHNADLDSLIAQLEFLGVLRIDDGKILPTDFTKPYLNSGSKVPAGA